MATFEELQQKLQQQEDRITALERGAPAPNRDCLTEKDVAGWLGCTVATVRKYTEQGLLPATWKNAERRYLREDVEKYMRGISPRAKEYRRGVSGS